MIFFLEKNKMCRMNVKVKVTLMKHYKSYWNRLPKEMQTMILTYRDSQDLIDRRESEANRKLCQQYREYECLPSVVKSLS